MTTFISQTFPTLTLFAFITDNICYLSSEFHIEQNMAQLQAYQRLELYQYLSVVSLPFEALRQRAFSFLNGRSMFVRVLFKCVTEVLKRPT